MIFTITSYAIQLPLREKTMKTLLVTAILLSNVALAQEKQSCHESFLALNSLIENNYPGFNEKTKDKVAYNYFKKGLTEKLKTSDKAQCFSILKEYVSYFKDDHIFFLGNSNYMKFDRIKHRETIRASKELLKKLTTSIDTLEGIWQDETSSIGIINDKNTYKGFIIKSKNIFLKPNDVLFTLNRSGLAKYFNTDSTSFDDIYSIDNKHILRFKKGRNIFVKGNQESELRLTSTIDSALGFYIKRMTNKTTIIKLKSFDYPFVNRIENLVEKNRNIIETSENLIIDLRDNGGGTTNAFATLLPYVLTGSTRNMNVETFVSDFLISGIEKYIRNLENSPKNNSEKDNLNKLLAYYRNNMYKYVLPLAENIVSVDSFALNIRSPKQVTFLVNKKVGSAAESFLMLAKQSKKVKVLGTPTHGILDYANAYITSFEYDSHPLILPTYRSLRLPDYPVDNIGIQPDVYIDKSVQDWEQFAIEYLEK